MTCASAVTAASGTVREGTVRDDRPAPSGGHRDERGAAGGRPRPAPASPGSSRGRGGTAARAAPPPRRPPGPRRGRPRASRSCSGLAEPVASTTPVTVAAVGSSSRSRASVCWVRSGGRRPYGHRSRTGVGARSPVSRCRCRGPRRAGPAAGLGTSRAAVSASSRGEPTRVTPVRRHHASTASSSSLPRAAVPAEAASARRAGGVRQRQAARTARVSPARSATACRQTTATAVLGSAAANASRSHGPTSAPRPVSTRVATPSPRECSAASTLVVTVAESLTRPTAPAGAVPAHQARSRPTPGRC